jgi:hypothetical protein
MAHVVQLAAPQVRVLPSLPSLSKAVGETLVEG